MTQEHRKDDSAWRTGTAIRDAAGNHLSGGETMNLLSRLCLTVCAFGLALEAGAKSAAEIFEEVSDSVVVVYGKNRQGDVISLASGVVLAAGEVITNCHVIKEIGDLSVKYKNGEHAATRKHSDLDRDVCSLTVQGLKATAARLGATQTLKVGQRVYVIGAPRGLELTLSEGIISSLREVEGGRYIQITAPISAGSSGGGLFDEEGRLIGLPTFYLSEGQQLNFAVPVEWVKTLPQREAAAREAATAITAWVNRAIELEAKDEWSGLLHHAQRWTRDRPSDDVAWFYLGIAYKKVNQTAKAIEAYRQAVLINPDFAGGWSELGDTYAHTDQKTKAIEAYRQVVRIKPNYVGGWYILSYAYERAGQSTQAIEAMQQRVRINPEDAGGWYQLGSKYSNAGQTAKAIVAYQQAVRINPDYTQVWYALGLAHGRTGQTARAIDAFQQAVRINPNDAWAWEALGDTYGRAGQTTQAITAYRKSLSINPGNDLAWYFLGEIYSLEGRKGEMMEVYRRLKDLNPDLADQFFNKYMLP